MRQPVGGTGSVPAQGGDDLAGEDVCHARLVSVGLVRRVVGGDDEADRTFVLPQEPHVHRGHPVGSQGRDQGGPVTHRRHGKRFDRSQRQGRESTRRTHLEPALRIEDGDGPPVRAEYLDKGVEGVLVHVLDLMRVAEGARVGEEGPEPVGDRTRRDGERWP